MLDGDEKSVRLPAGPAASRRRWSEAEKRRIVAESYHPGVSVSVERERVVAFHTRLSGVPYAANRAVAVLSRMYGMAASWGMVPDGTNPCRGGVRKFPTRPRERFLTDTEFRRLGAVLDRAEADGGVSGHAVAAIRLLLLTGCRKSEILSLKWQDVDLAAGELRLADSKTGPRAVPLSPPAVRVLEGLPRVADSPWVIPGQKPGTDLTTVHDPISLPDHDEGLHSTRRNSSTQPPGAIASLKSSACHLLAADMKTPHRGCSQGADCPCADRSPARRPRDPRTSGTEG